MAEYWKRLSEVLAAQLFTIGDHPVTVGTIVVFLLILLGTLIVASVIEGLLANRLLAKAKGRGVGAAVGRLAKYIIYAIGLMVAFQTVGVSMSSVAVILGFLSVGIGFGLQNVTSNFISGIILLLERPVSVGDRITVDGILCDVEDIRMRSTIVRSIDNVIIIVPNSKFIEQNVTNWSFNDLTTRIRVNVGVAYGTDPEMVREVLLKVASADPEVKDDPPASVSFTDFGSSSLDFALFVYVGDLRVGKRIASDLRFEIEKAFREAGIEIPFPQQDVYVKSLPAPVHDAPLADA